MGSTEFLKNRLDSSIGRIVEQYKVNLKKVNRDLNRLKNEGVNNSFENILFQKGEEFIQRGEKAVDNIYKNGYYDLIKRSMKNREICLGAVDFNNLTKEDKLKVKYIKKCSHNMVEVDCFNFLYKYKKRGLNLDFNELSLMFCNFEDLDIRSHKFIISLLCFPYEFTRQCNKYRVRKKDLTDEEYALKLQKAIVQDSLCLI